MDVNEIILSESTSVARERRFPCLVCLGKSKHRGFGRRCEWERHMMIHTGERPFKCSKCEKAFIQKSALTVHMRVHTGEKPHKCERCHATFADSSSLSRHRKTHAGPRPYLCEFKNCTQAFSTRRAKSAHQRSHLGVSLASETGNCHIFAFPKRNDERSAGPSSKTDDAFKPPLYHARNAAVATAPPQVSPSSRVPEQTEPQECEATLPLPPSFNLLRSPQAPQPMELEEPVATSPPLPPLQLLQITPSLKAMESARPAPSLPLPQLRESARPSEVSRGPGPALLQQPSFPPPYKGSEPVEPREPGSAPAPLQLLGTFRDPRAPRPVQQQRSGATLPLLSSSRPLPLPEGMKPQERRVTLPPLKPSQRVHSFGAPKPHESSQPSRSFESFQPPSWPSVPSAMNKISPPSLESRPLPPSIPARLAYPKPSEQVSVFAAPSLLSRPAWQEPKERQARAPGPPPLAPGHHSREVVSLSGRPRRSPRLQHPDRTAHKEEPTVPIQLPASNWLSTADRLPPTVGSSRAPRVPNLNPQNLAMDPGWTLSGMGTRSIGGPIQHRH